MVAVVVSPSGQLAKSVSYRLKSLAKTFNSLSMNVNC